MTLTTAKYAAKRGGICPNCLSGPISVDSMAEIFDGGGHQSCHCMNCKAEWDDIYKLEGYANLVVPVNK